MLLSVNQEQIAEAGAQQELVCATGEVDDLSLSGKREQIAEAEAGKDSELAKLRTRKMAKGVLERAAAKVDMPRFLKFGRLSTMKLVLVAITSLLLATEAQPTVLKLKRHNTLPGRDVELPVNGTGHYMFHGPYLTRVKLGNPPQSFDVLIDTGSSIPWVGCDTSAGLATQLFHPGPSTLSLSCPDQRCQTLAHAGYGGCNSSTNGCVYDLRYGNGDSGTFSSTRGYYISDFVHSDGPSTPARIVFGCTNSWMGQLSHGSFDGILGLAPFGMSFISQLYSSGVSGKIFTLCMHSPTGGGILAFGEAVEPGLTYTALLPSQLSTEPRLGSVCGRYSIMRAPGSLWLLGATGGRRSHGLSSADLDGKLIIG